MSDWLHSYDNISRSISVPANGIILFFLNGWRMLHCAYVAHLYPFPCWWRFGLLSWPGSCEHSCSGHRAACVSEAWFSPGVGLGVGVQPRPRSQSRPSAPVRPAPLRSARKWLPRSPAQGPEGRVPTSEKAAGAAPKPRRLWEWRSLEEDPQEGEEPRGRRDQRAVREPQEGQTHSIAEEGCPETR